MLRTTIATISAALIGLSAGVASAQADQSGTTLKATHGAWEIRCGVQNTESCVMAQMGNNDKGEPVLRTLLRKTPDLKGPNGEPIAAVMEIIAPIGVLLQAGVGVQIDGKEVGRGSYRYCTPQACLVAEPVQQEFIDQLKKGSNAIFSIRGLNGEAANVTISLSGFTKAFNGL